MFSVATIHACSLCNMCVMGQASSPVSWLARGLACGWVAGSTWYILVRLVYLLLLMCYASNMGALPSLFIVCACVSASWSIASAASHAGSHHAI
ncbi:hypothetical protein BKA93DRAFT_759381 [Sparassis latifolia]